MGEEKNLIAFWQLYVQTTPVNSVASSTLGVFKIVQEVLPMHDVKLVAASNTWRKSKSSMKWYKVIDRCKSIYRNPLISVS